MSNRPPFPEVLDSTILAAAKSCQQKVYQEFFHHWKSREPSVHLKAGAAYAKGLEVGRKMFYEEGIAADLCVADAGAALLKDYGDFQCPPESAKSAERTLGALEFYFDRYPLGVDKAEPLIVPGGKRAIEFNGVEALEMMHPETGNPLQYSWRMDMAVDYNGMKLGLDDKTTSQLGASWPRQWDLRSQFTGYIWGAQNHGLKLDGFLVRGVSILKKSYDTLEAITYRPQWQIDRWYEQTHYAIDELITAWKNNRFKYDLDHACAEYGGCPFRNVCLNRDPQPILEQMFQRRQWNPVTREEIIL